MTNYLETKVVCHTNILRSLFTAFQAKVTAVVKRTTMEKEIMSLNPSARFVHTYKERQRVKTEREMLRWREMSDKQIKRKRERHRDARERERQRKIYAKRKKDSSQTDRERQQGQIASVNGKSSCYQSPALPGFTYRILKACLRCQKLLAKVQVNKNEGRDGMAWGQSADWQDGRGGLADRMSGWPVSTLNASTSISI